MMLHLRSNRIWAPPEGGKLFGARLVVKARRKARTESSSSSIIIELAELLNTNQLNVTYRLLHLILLKFALLLLFLSQPLSASARLVSALGFVDEFANLNAHLDVDDLKLELQLSQIVRSEQVASERSNYSAASRAMQLMLPVQVGAIESNSTQPTDPFLDSDSLQMYQNGFSLTNQTFGDNRTIASTTNSSSTLNQLLIGPGDASIGGQSNAIATNADDDDGTTMYTLLVVCANFFILAVGLCGNSIVILVIWNNHRETTVNHIYIKNLAYADLMFTVGLFFLNTTMITHRWIFGNWMCKIYMATTSLSQFGSSFLLVAMAFDRFIAVCHPIFAQRFRQNDKASAICFVIWFWCSILTIPILMFAKNNEGDTCAIYWPEYSTFNSELTFILYSCFFGFGLPECFIGVFYACVIKTLRRSAMMQMNLNSTRRSQNRDATNRRIETVVISIILTFTICWLPYWITQLMVGFSSGEDPPVPYFYEFFLAASCLSYTNSALNPILYAFLSDNFNRQCRNVLGNFRLVKWAQSVGHSQAEGQDHEIDCRIRGCVRPAASWTTARLAEQTSSIQPEPETAASCCATNSCLLGPAAGSGEPGKVGAIRRQVPVGSRASKSKRSNRPSFELDEFSALEEQSVVANTPIRVAHNKAADQKATEEENKLEVVVVVV